MDDNNPHPFQPTLPYRQRWWGTKATLATKQHQHITSKTKTSKLMSYLSAPKKSVMTFEISYKLFCKKC